MKTSWKYMIAASFALCACSDVADVADEAADAPDSEPEARIVDLGYSSTIDGTATPVAVLTPTPETTLAFYAWENLSAGVLMTATSGGPDFLGAPELENLSVTEIFWALSPPGSDIPSALVEYQDALEQDGERSWQEVRSIPQGWGHDISFLRVHANCVNATFTANHCLPASPYTHDVCVTDTNGNLAWETAATRNYKAGFCLDSGTVDDYLWYDEQAGEDEYGCLWWHTPTVIWGNPGWGGLPGTFNANTYLSWVWAASSGGPSRIWRHDSSNGGGADNYDWAIRQKPDAYCNDF